MKAIIRNWFKKRGLYESIKYSRFFHWYERFLKPSVARQHQKEVSLYRSFLPPSKLIFDIGAYDGHKTAAFLEISEKVLCCEPDAYNFRLLQTRFRKHLGRRVSLQQLAVSSDITQQSYYTHHDGSAFNTLNPQWKAILEKDGINRWNEEIRFDRPTHTVTTTTLDALIGQYGLPDFIKIDAEGSEWWILQGLSQPVPCLSFECLLPEFKTDLELCIGKINSLDSTATFNIIFNEQLVLDAFVDFNALQQWLATTSLGCFEIIAKMKV
jgi:FkbM family methyltransferase